MVLAYSAVAASPLIPTVWFFFKWLDTSGITDEASLANHRDNLSNAFIPLGMAIALLLAVLTLLK